MEVASDLIKSLILFQNVNLNSYLGYYLYKVFKVNLNFSQDHIFVRNVDLKDNLNS